MAEKEYIVETEEYQKKLYKVRAETEGDALIKVYQRKGESIGSTLKEIRYAHCLKNEKQFNRKAQ